MKCLVCSAAWSDERGTTCPRCRYDHAAERARELPSLNAARAAYRDSTAAYAAHDRVSVWDKLRPWAALVLGFALFVLWLRACGTWGFRLW